MSGTEAATTDLWWNRATTPLGWHKSTVRWSEPVESWCSVAERILFFGTDPIEEAVVAGYRCDRAFPAPACSTDAACTDFSTDLSAPCDVASTPRHWKRGAERVTKTWGMIVADATSLDEIYESAIANGYQRRNDTGHPSCMSRARPHAALSVDTSAPCATPALHSEVWLPDAKWAEFIGTCTPPGWARGERGVTKTWSMISGDASNDFSIPESALAHGYVRTT